MYIMEVIFLMWVMVVKEFIFEEFNLVVVVMMGVLLIKVCGWWL